MTQTYMKGAAEAIHRIDVPLRETGFTIPPCDVHVRLLPSPATDDGWMLLVQVAAGKADRVARWLRTHPGITKVGVAPGLAPKVLCASMASLPPAWETVASFVRVHHVDLSPDSNAAWFVEGGRDQVWSLVQHLDARIGPDPTGLTQVHCHPVGHQAHITRRQFEALATAVSLGYYEIPHRLDLRALASHTGLSLASASELLRRAEGAVVTNYVDAHLLRKPVPDDG